MRKIELTETPELEQVIPKATGEDVLITRNGHAVALVSGFDDDDLEFYARERDPSFLRSLNDAREQVKKGEFVRQEDVGRHLGFEESGAVSESPDAEASIIAEAKRRLASGQPRYSSAQVSSFLRSLEEEWERTGGFDEEYMRAYLKQLKTGASS